MRAITSVLAFASMAFASMAFASMAFALLTVGCVVDRGEPRCEDDAQCDADRRCYRGFCVLRGALDGGGTDAGVDSGVVCTGTNTSCETTMEGACVPGRELTCDDGTMRCEPVVMASAEMCNGEDDDCDGRTDETFLPLNTEENCGACGASCGDGLQCCASREGGGALRCVDTTSDDEFCGGCANPVCDVAAGSRCCGSTCRNLLTDRMNCGVCGRECPGGQQCCDGDCVATDSDPDHCGECGTECTGSDRCCRGDCAAPASAQCGSCAEECGALACCNGSCVDTDTDRNACGSCNNVCDGEGEFCCDGDCVTSDRTHCGACGVECGADELCCNDSCVSNNSPNCGACGTTCAPGTACCGNGCTDLQSDEMNCGTCGMACQSGQTCSAGRCCGAGLTNCGGTCVNLQNDASNCGRCGRDCVVGCSGGGCVLL